MIRKANDTDIDAVVNIYDELHQAEKDGFITVGWIRDVYPTRVTAEKSIERKDLFVLEENGMILGAGIINQLQMKEYQDAPWEHKVSDNQVCVLHTLVISPKAIMKGLGKKFVGFYEDYAKENNLHELRIDTNERNLTARMMYSRLGYKEISVVPTVFNGIPDVNLVLLEKWLGD